MPPIIVFDYQMSRHGRHARNFQGTWRRSLCVDDCAGYDKLFKTAAEDAIPCIEVGCMAHSRRKFFDLHAANGSPMAAEALRYIQRLYVVEADAKMMSVSKRQMLRLARSVPLLASLQQFLTDSRARAADNGSSAKAIDYILKRWEVPSRYALTGDLPIDNNPVERSIRPVAIGKKNWLFVGSEGSGQRAAIIQSLISTAKLNGIDHYAWLKNTLACISVWPHQRIDDLLPIQGWEPRHIP